MVDFSVYEVLQLVFVLWFESLSGEMAIEHQQRVVAEIKAMDHTGILGGTLWNSVVFLKGDVFRPTNREFAVDLQIHTPILHTLHLIGIGLLCHGLNDGLHSFFPIV